MPRLIWRTIACAQSANLGAPQFGGPLDSDGGTPPHRGTSLDGLGQTANSPNQPPRKKKSPHPWGHPRSVHWSGRKKNPRREVTLPVFGCTGDWGPARAEWVELLLGETMTAHRRKSCIPYHRGFGLGITVLENHRVIGISPFSTTKHKASAVPWRLRR